jgi:hypothetical protein
MLLQTIEPVSFLESNGPTWIVLGLFVLLSLAAGGLALLLGKLLFRTNTLRFYSLHFYVMLGGLIGIFMHLYATHYLSISRDKEISSLINMFSVFSVFTFINMLAIPILAMLLRSKNRKIKDLQEELKNKNVS